MDETPIVHEIQAFKRLPRNLLPLGFGQRSCEMALEITEFEEFHGDENRIFMLIPSTRAHKAVSVLLGYQ